MVAGGFCRDLAIVPVMSGSGNIFGLCIVTVFFGTMIGLNTLFLTGWLLCDLSLIQCMGMALSTSLSLAGSRSIAVIFPIVSEGRTGFKETSIRRPNNKKTKKIFYRKIEGF